MGKQPCTATTAPPLPIEHASNQVLGARVGHLVAVDERGRPVVDFPGNPHGPRIAQVALSTLDRSQLLDNSENAPLLLVFADNDLCRPIVVGLVTDTLQTAGLDVVLRAHRIALHADEEIELRRGDAKIVMDAMGKIVTLGREIVSRAREQCRIKGATVKIN